jgi:deferrochelatase/peroxidase EfeB
MQLSDVDYRDIQGLVRFGHGHMAEASFCLAEIADAAAARAWLAAAPVTTASRSAALPQRALQVAFTHKGLRKLGLPDAILDSFSAEFRSGMVEANRSRRLGDIEANDPARWHWGIPGKLEPDVLIMLYAVRGELAGWMNEIQDDVWETAFAQPYHLSTIHPDDTEPFGFVDSTSQPRIDWQRLKPARLRTTTEYSNVSALGEFLLGYPNEYGRYTDRPLLDPRDDPADTLPLAEDEPGKKDFGRNGSYLVLRDLAQDVAGFRRFLDGQFADPHARRALAAAMTGRMPADLPVIPDGYSIIEADDPERIIPRGGPVARLSQDNVEGVGPGLKDVWLNQFTFRNDPDGTACPYGAHIRRANPRNADLPEGTRGWIGRLIRTLGFARTHPHDDLLASTRFHRILRRGREYESEAQADGSAEDQGLRFVCLNANIARQFEFVQTSWLANPKFNGLNEDDPLVGNRAPLFTGEAADSFTRRRDSGLSSRANHLEQFVTVRGGGYFFMPGLSALRFIAQTPG